MLKINTNRFNKKSVSGIKIICWGAASIFIVTYILLGLQTVTSGAKFASLEKEEIQLNKKNKELSALLMQSNSLIKLEDKSQELGFVKPENIVYIGKSETVAELH